MNTFIFDIDGTLIDSVGMYISGLQKHYAVMAKNTPVRSWLLLTVSLLLKVYRNWASQTKRFQKFSTNGPKIQQHSPIPWIISRV